MKGYTNNSLTGTLRDERGSSAFSFAGYLIIIAVIIGAIVLLRSGDFGTQAQNKNFVSAKNALQKKHWTEAAALFTKAIQDEPENVSAYLGRSKAYLHLNKLDKALADANTALKKKTSAQAYGQKAIVEKIQQKTADAIKDFKKSINAQSSYAWAHAQLADIYSRNNDQDNALKEIDKAISFKHNSVDFLRLRAWIHSRNGQCKKATQDFLAARNLDPKNAWTMEDRAWFLLTCPDEKLQDSTKAMVLAKKALTLVGGRDGVIQETLAEAFFKQGDFLNAVKHQQAAIKLMSPQCPDGSCLKEMQGRLKKYELAARRETRTNYEILKMDSGS
jgi:tetratricopeptide (TPR) repeat protein